MLPKIKKNKTMCMSTPCPGFRRLPTFCSLSQVTHQQNRDGGWQTRERDFRSDKMKLKTKLN